MRAREHAHCLRRATNVVQKTGKPGIQHKDTNGVRDKQTTREQQKSAR